MKRVNLRRALIVAGLMPLVIVYVLLWSRMLSSHEERTGSDFISAYTAGRVTDLWGGAHVYDLARQQAVQAEVVGFDLAPGQVLMFNHPPYLVPLLAVLMDGDYVASLVRYALLMTLLYGASLLITWHLLKRDGWPKNDAPWRWQGWQLFPLFVNLLNPGYRLHGCGSLAGASWPAHRPGLARRIGPGSDLCPPPRDPGDDFAFSVSAPEGLFLVRAVRSRAGSDRLDGCGLARQPGLFANFVDRSGRHLLWLTRSGNGQPRWLAHPPCSSLACDCQSRYRLGSLFSLVTGSVSDLAA